MWVVVEMKIRVNGFTKEIEKMSVKEAIKEFCPEADLVILNAFPIKGHPMLKEGDDLYVIKKGAVPPEDMLQALMSSRHTPKVHEKIRNGKVGIAGLGGLGSHAALALARMGVGELVLIDFDVVEPSNLNRQAYTLKHMGAYKTEAMKIMIQDINPYIKVTCHTLFVDAMNVCNLFDGCDVVIEAFDQAFSKQVLVETLLSQTKIPIVAGSGVAGYYSSNLIQTKRVMKRLYVVGDGENEAGPFQGLMAPRVMVASAHQANMALRLLLKEEEV